MTDEAEGYRIGDAERALGGLTAVERSYRDPEDKCDEQCCQCLCPMDRKGTIWHKPQRRAGEQDKEYHSRLIKEWREMEWPKERPLASRCWIHNDPNNPDRKKKGKSNFDKNNLPEGLDYSNGYIERGPEQDRHRGERPGAQAPDQRQEAQAVR